MIEAEPAVLARLSRRFDRERRARLEAEAIAERFTREALHDGLTGLPNRTLFMDRLAVALERCAHRELPLTVLFLDLDRFKVINDTLGHGTGDRLLVEIAQRLKSAVRPGDTVARFGGDEFAILCASIHTREDAIATAKRLSAAIASPFTVGDIELSTSASIGISIAVGTRATPDEILRDGDAAMYRAKERGTARFQFFEQAVRRRDRERLETESDLRHALERGELALAYQPIVRAQTLELVGVEALLRWHHPQRGVVAPAEFVPIAEESGLILSLGEWVLREACARIAAWRSRRPDWHSLRLSVNLSACQVVEPELQDVVIRILAETGLEPAGLCLEITESSLLSHDTVAAANLRTLHDLGVRIAIDDFGTGYSSLVHLKQFPATSVKIDRTFVGGLGRDPSDTAIVAAVVAMAHAVGLTTVAEGVETAEQLAAVREIGCDFAQGDHVSPPLPPERFERHATSRERARQASPLQP